ncbi:MAG: aldehyde dehydrogenase [Desulfobacterales bacterium]
MMNAPEILNIQRNFFLSGKTKSIRFRISQLMKFRQILKENESLLFKAIDKDFGKSAYETYGTELSVIYSEIKSALKNIKKWSKPVQVRTTLKNFPGKGKIFHEPFGNTLIIGAWNYPYQLSLVPAVSAIAAGNTAIIKPSDLAANTSSVMARLINENFDSGFLFLKEGGIAVSTELLKQKFDKIFFTGSTSVGKIVYRAAAEHLTPVTLELGGKSPAFVLPDADLARSARRIAWGKFLNAGQTCVAPDYALVHRNVKDEFLNKLKEQILKIHGKNPKDGETYVRIINQKNFDRLLSLIEKNKIFWGGKTDREKLYISPTIISGISFNDKIMNDEIFGPILPVIEFSDLDCAIKEVKNKPKPLSLYIFTNSSAKRDRILHEISFGGGCVNDTVMHLASPELPFGGVGLSGMGKYHGKAGFLAFSHSKSILYKGLWFEPFFKYKPYTSLKLKLLKWIME